MNRDTKGQEKPKTALQERVHKFVVQRFDMQQGEEQNYAPYLLEILEKLGWRGDVRMLTDSFLSTSDKKSLGLTEFLNIMAYLGFNPNILELSRENITDDLCPCLFIPLGKEGYSKGEIVLDPYANIKRGETSSEEQKVRGRAFVFTKEHSDQDISCDKTIAASGKPWFIKLMFRFKGVFKQVLLASLFINLLTLVTPIFMMSVYDKVIGDHSAHTLNHLFVGVMLAIAIEFLLRFVRTKSLSWFSARVDYIISSTIIEKLLSLPASYTERANVSAQLSRLRAFESIREFFTGPLFLSFVELPFTILLLVAIALIAGYLVIIPLFVAVLFILLLFSLRERIKALTSRMTSANAQRQSINTETLSKQETLRYSGGFDSWLERYEKASANASYSSYLYSNTLAFADSFSHNLIILGGVAMIYFSIGQIWAGEMTMGAMIAALILTWRILAPLQMASMAVPRVRQVKHNIDQVNRLMALPPEGNASQSRFQAIPHFKGKVEFHNVGLRYNKDSEPIYAGLSFIAQPGQVVAIVGANSTGKSTTLNLISGLYHPQAGSVRIDGTDVRQSAPMKLRQNISYVAQEPEFFSMSLADNLRLSKPDATFEEIGAALKKFGAFDWVRTLPDGLDTHIGHGSPIQIPSALLHQLALARAYIQDSQIMLIDEMPYGFLNSEAGNKYYNFLKSQKGKRTIIFVTYRQDYIDLANQVVQLYNDERPQIKIREGSNA